MVARNLSQRKFKQKYHNGVIAIGNFDGLHIGHQKAINEAKHKAKINCCSV